MYLKKIERWNSPDYPYEKPKGLNVAYLRVLSGEIDKYGWCKGIYRVYYGKRLYDECSNNSQVTETPKNKKMRFVNFVKCRKTIKVGEFCGRMFGIDKILDKLLPKCPYS